MWPHEEALADEPIVVRGSSIEEAARTAQELIGRQVRVVKADRIRRGGIAGFFATDLGVEVTVVPVGAAPSDSPSVSFAEAFDRLMEDASSGDWHSVSAPLAQPADEAFMALLDEVSSLPRVDRSDVGSNRGVDPVVELPPLLASNLLGQLSVPPAFVPSAFVPPAPPAPPAAPVPAPPAAELPAPSPAPAPVPPVMPEVVVAPTAMPEIVQPTAVAVPAVAAPAADAPQVQAPPTLTTDHGRMARDVAEAMISQLGEHTTVSVTVRVSLPDGSELRADVRAGNRL